MINIKKSAAPASVDWKNIEIRNQIKTDFFEICYVCERHVPIDYEIDHFCPQLYFKERENDWGNLYYICQKCNKIKPKDANSTTETQILDCCHDDVESIIQLFYDETTKRIEIPINTNYLHLASKANNTVHLLSNSIEKKIVIL